MKIYILVYDNGEDYEFHERREVGVFNNKELAIKSINDKEFFYDEENNYYVRTLYYNDGTVRYKHEEFIYITTRNINELDEEVLDI